MSKSELFHLRRGYYEWVAEAVDRVALSVTSLRQTNDGYEHRIYKCKLIAVVDSVTSAVELKGKIDNEARAITAQMATIGQQGGLKVTPIKMKVDIVNATGDVALTVRPAQCRVSDKGSEIRQRIEVYLDHLRKQDPPDDMAISVAERLHDSIKARDLYISATDSGAQYRVTYYNYFDGKRYQRSVGDVLIVVGNEQTKIVEAPLRKARADKSAPLGIYYTYPAPEIAILHQVYPFNPAYIKRRKQRLLNK